MSDLQNNNTKALKSGVWYTAANFLVRSIGLITTPLFARLLTHEEFGLYNNFTSWLSILTIIVTLNLESTFISARFDFEKDFDEYILSVQTLSSLSALLSALILNLLYVPFADKLGMSRFHLNCMMVYLLLLPAWNMFQARERYFFKYKISVGLSLLVSFGTAGLSVLLVWLMQDKLNGRILGSLIPTVAVGLVLYVLIWVRGKRFTPKYWKYAIRICLPFIPHLLSMSVLNAVDKIMITNMRGAEENALYSIAYTCGTIVSILIVSMNTAFSPWLGQKLHDEEYDEVRSFSYKYVLLFFALAFAVLLFAPEILYILGGESYLEAVYVMPPVACGCMFQFLYTMFVNVEQFKKKTVGMMFASISAAALNYVLNYFLIPRFGYIAAAYTTLAGFLWLLISHMYLVRRYGYKNVYSYPFVAAMAGVALLVSLAMNLLYAHNPIRYAVGGVYLLGIAFGLFRYRKLLLGFLKGVLKK